MKLFNLLIKKQNKIFFIINLIILIIKTSEVNSQNIDNKEYVNNNIVATNKAIEDNNLKKNKKA